eukprot:scaffold6436_cov158-Amphora_coffeaeformis.AAC.2
MKTVYASDEHFGFANDCLLLCIDEKQFIASTAIAAIFVSHDVTTGSVAFFGHVHVRIQIEKIVGHELKAHIDTVLDREVFATYGMVQTKRMPRDNVRVGNAAPLLHVVFQTTLSIGLIDVFTRRVALFFVVWSHPQLLVGPCHALARKGVGITKYLDRLRWFELVSNRVTGMIGLVRIHEFPVAFCVGITRKATFSVKRLGLDEKRIAKGILFRI